VLKFGGGKTRINWYSALLLRAVNLSNPHCNP
jgi:hypothetical protein